MPKKSKAPLGSIISNGDVINRNGMQDQSFPVGTRFIISNSTYNMEEFRVSDVTQDSGTDFRRMQSRLSDVVMPLSSLKIELSKGNIKFLDQKGNIIK